MMHRNPAKLLYRLFRSHPLYMRTLGPGRQVIKGRFLYSNTLQAANYSTSSPEEKAFRPKAAAILERAFSEGRHIKSVQCVDDKEWVEVEWKDGLVTEYPYIWLRDNCQCETCFNKFSLNRFLPIKELDLDTKPKKIENNHEEKTLTISWTDGHESRFLHSWLEGRSFKKEQQEKRLQFLTKGKPKPWGRELQSIVPTYEFDQIISDDMTLYKWICSVEELGVSVLTNAPSEVGQLKKIGDRVGHLRRTGYGDTFQVMTKEGPSNLAYTSGELCFHADLVDYDNIPGLQLLHCIKSQCEGGDNQFADVLNAAMILKVRHPDMYKLLTTTLVDFYDVGTDDYTFFTCSRRPYIELDIEGNLKRVFFNNMSRNSFSQVPLDKIIKLYKAMKTFNSILYEEENHIVYKPKPGDIVTFDNTRVAHARSAYQVTKGGERHLEGCYIDWDEISSTRRVLMMALNLL